MTEHDGTPKREPAEKDGFERCGLVTWTQIEERRRELARDLELDRLRKLIRGIK